MLLWGERDPVVPAASAAALLQALPHARLEILPGLGHLPHAEDPAAFCAAVTRFLE
ncbi:MAG: alpha/beta fold hydrolase [Terriglobales bacterium]